MSRKMRFPWPDVLSLSSPLDGAGLFLPSIVTCLQFAVASVYSSLGSCFKNSLRLVGAGIFVGLLLSYTLSRFLASQISGVSATGPATFAAVVAIVVSASLTACLLPARRASQTDPLVALRYE
jgi:hypothetical protein